MPRFLGGLLLAGALVPVGCGVGGGDSVEAVEKSRITRAQLAAMVLPQAELGTIAQGLNALDDNGLVQNGAAADDTVDPEDTATSLRSRGRVSGYRLGFEGANLAAVSRRGGLFLVGTEVELMEDTVYAAQYLHKQVGDYHGFRGKTVDGVRLSRVSGFDVVGVGDEVEGLLVTVSAGGVKLRMTFVAFRRDGIIGAATIVRGDEKDVRGEARALAVKLDRRIQDVLAGKAEVTPPPEAEQATKTAISSKEKLPRLTLTAEDVGAKPIVQWRSDDDGYLAYNRTFEDVQAKDAHLIRLHAQTQLYPTAAKAALARRIVMSPAGRRAYARYVLDNLATDLGGKPVDVQITLVSNLGPGVRGVDVIFTAGGTPFRFTTGFIRAGRAIEAVTGFCRANAFHPSDLGPLAQRARERLSANV